MFMPVDPPQIITLAIEPPSAPADGVTPLVLSATVTAGLPAGRRTPLEAKRRYLFRLVFLNEQSGKTAFTVEGRTSHNNYVGADAGVLYAGDVAIGAFYVGSNIYFRPVNKDAPLGLGSITRRLALTVGITVSPIADENNRTRSDLFWN